MGGVAAELAKLARPRILVIVMRRLGDVLLTTPLIRTLRHALPHAAIDVLVFAGSEGILAGNPDIDQVITLPQRPSVVEVLALVRRLWRRYDLALSTQTGDRPTMLAHVASRRRTGLVPVGGGPWWKRALLNVPVTSEPNTHRVVDLLRLTDGLGFVADPQLVPPARGLAGTAISGLPLRYAVLHPHPMYRYKRWSDDGWRALAAALAGRGLAVAVTGSPEPAERAYLDALWPPVGGPVHRLDGRLDWPQLADLMRGAAVYIGVDTSMSHLAASTGCPTVTLYGPTDPRLIGPWPVGGLKEEWAAAGQIQRRGNTWLVQNPLPCLPCDLMGCERHNDSPAQCLEELPVAQVLEAVDQALAAGASAPEPAVRLDRTAPSL